MKVSHLIKTIGTIAVLTAVWTSMGLAATTRIAIVPFQINAMEDYTFLQKGIVQMLTSRLSSEQVSVIDPDATAKAVAGIEGMTGDSLALMAGAKLQADYVIHGSITVLGESVSIDSKMLNVTGTREPFHFFKQTPAMNDVIPQINRLATEINTAVFGRTATAAAPQAAAPPPSPAPAVTGDDPRAHPEKLLQGGHFVSEGSPQQGGASPLNPAFIKSAGRSDGKAAFWKSRNYSKLFNGLDVGDVNKDGRLETVVVAPGHVMIFQSSGNRLQLLKEIKTGRFTQNIGVDIADINGNGTPEVFVTAFNNQLNALDSYVMEYDGKDYKTISKNRWYFRVVRHPAEGKKLLGQGQRSGQNDPFSSPIFELAWNGAEYVTKNRVLPGRKANLLGTAMGDIMNDGNETVLAFNTHDHLRVFKPNGSVEWTGQEYYGGSPLYFAMPPEGRGSSHTPFFLPVRIRVTDVGEDGKYKVIVPQNIDTAGRKLAQRRHYKRSKIAALEWNGLGLTPAWQTGRISGRIQDLAIADFDNDGADELVAMVVMAEGALVGTKPKSAIIAYELNQTVE